MSEPEKLILSVATNEGAIDVVAYLPFAGAEFCAHRHVTIGAIWCVSHVRTSLKLPIDEQGTKEAAIDLARRLSEQCPSAKLIEWAGENDGYHGLVTGPKSDLAAEVKAVIEAEAA